MEPAFHTSDDDTKSTWNAEQYREKMQRDQDLSQKRAGTAYAFGASPSRFSVWTGGATVLSGSAGFGGFNNGFNSNGFHQHQSTKMTEEVKKLTSDALWNSFEAKLKNMFGASPSEMDPLQTDWDSVFDELNIRSAVNRSRLLHRFENTRMRVPVHASVHCDGCGQAPLRGIRFKCMGCPNLDLCQKCFSVPSNCLHVLPDQHTKDHVFAATNK